MSVNFDTENLVVVYYPQFSGGKFLINCLGLSDDAVMQSAQLAQKQLNQDLTQLDKFEFLREKFSEIDDKWNDLALGCAQLFGGPLTQDYVNLGPDTIKNSIVFNQVIETLTQGNKKFFIAAHNSKVLSGIVDLWPRCKIISFVNCQAFLDLRLGDQKESFVQRNLQQHQLNSEQVKKTYPQALEWDTNNYFSKDKTVHAVAKLYTQLNLGNFDPVIIQQYHQLWIDKLMELQSK
jgi:hypothetical protein